MIGQMLGHYRIVSKLGEGGMGKVYRAHDERLHRDVALKLLTGDVAGSMNCRERVLAEARAAAILNHPGIATVYEVGEEGDHVFIVMELVQGETLRQRLTIGPLEPRALVRIGAQIAEGLEVAHTRGIIHGDIKPQNILIQSDGRVKLFDFGIARQIATDTATLTRSAVGLAELPPGLIAGTLAYMAPEVLRGDPSDTRSDLYSLGVVLFELASGRGRSWLLQLRLLWRRFFTNAQQD